MNFFRHNANSWSPKPSEFVQSSKKCKTCRIRPAARRLEIYLYCWLPREVNGANCSQCHPVSKFWAKLQFMVWDRGEREFPFPVIPYSLIDLGVSESRESRSLRSHGSHRTLDKSQTNAISVTFCALVEVSWGNLGKATAEKIKRIVIDAIFCPLVQASWGRIWKRKV